MYADYDYSNTYIIVSRFSWTAQPGRLSSDTHFTPWQCCQACGVGEEYKSFRFIDGRCEKVTDGRKQDANEFVVAEHWPITMEPRQCCFWCGHYAGDYTWKDTEPRECLKVR